MLEDARLGDLGGVAGEGLVVGQGGGGVVGAVHVVVEEDGALVVTAGGGCGGGGSGGRGSGFGGLHNGGCLLDWGGLDRLHGGVLLGGLGRGCWRRGLDDGLRSRGGGWHRLALDEHALGGHRCDGLGDSWGHDRRGRGCPCAWDEGRSGLIGV